MILLTGASGMLGAAIADVLRFQRLPFLSPSHQDLDIRDPDAIFSYFKKNLITAVIHCAAYTKVDLAEDEVELCRSVNVEGTKHIAKQCAMHHAQMVYVSTDYVFDGTKPAPYEVTDLANPLSVYGRTKWEGEQFVRMFVPKHFIIRVSWLYGQGSYNFVYAILRQKETHMISVVEDQIGSPSYVADVATGILDVMNQSQYGTFHLTNEGYCSYADWAQKIVENTGMQAEILRVPTSQLQRKAMRPLNSCLSKQSLERCGIQCLPPWEAALKRFINEIVEEQK